MMLLHFQSLTVTFLNLPLECMKIIPENEWTILQRLGNSQKIISNFKSLAFLCEVPQISLLRNLKIFW
ncbi:hypothetical protein LIAUS_04040 [Leptospira interrogans]|nr:Uncharacterized protein AAY48_0761 [Leptospira interrogans serovar Muenchen]